MIGEHKLTLTETNTGSFVPVCSCHWMGLAHGTPIERSARGAITKRHKAVSEQQAIAEHAKHVERCRRPLVDRMNP